MIAGLAVLSIIGTGCGTGGGVGSHPSSGGVAALSTGSPSTSSAKDALAAYLSAFYPIRIEIRSAADAGQRALHGMTNDTTDWPSRAAELNAAISKMDEGAVRLASLAAVPPNLRHATAQYVQGVQKIEGVFSSIHRLLAAKDVQSLDTMARPTALDQAGELLIQWRQAVEVRCHRLGVPVPRWVKQTGA